MSRPSGAGPLTPNLARLAAGLLRIAVTAVLLWVVLGAIGIEPIARAIAWTDPKWLLLALGVLALQFFTMAKRWQLLLHLLFDKKIPLGPLALSIGQGMLASQALPATVGGDAYRMALVAGRIGASAAVRSVVCDRLLALALLIALVVALLPFMTWRLGATAAVLVVAATSVSALSIFVALIVAAPSIAHVPLIGYALAAVANDARRALFAGADGYAASALGMATHLLAVGLVYLLALSVNATITLLDCLLIVPPALLVSALPVSLGGWGVREGAFLAGFAMLGGEPAAGVTVSILFGGTGILLGAICALIALLPGTRPRGPRTT